MNPFKQIKTIITEYAQQNREALQEVIAEARQEFVDTGIYQVFRHNGQIKTFRQFDPVGIAYQSPKIADWHFLGYMTKAELDRI